MNGEKFKKFRAKFFKTQTAAAIALGVSSKTVSAWECNRNPIPPLAIKYLRLLQKRGKEGKKP